MSRWLRFLSALSFLLIVVIQSHSVQSLTVDATDSVRNVDARITLDATTSVLKYTVALNVENTGDRPLTHYLFVAPPFIAHRIAFIRATVCSLIFTPHACSTPSLSSLLNITSIINSLEKLFRAQLIFASHKILRN